MESLQCAGGGNWQGDEGMLLSCVEGGGREVFAHRGCVPFADISALAAQACRLLYEAGASEGACRRGYAVLIELLENTYRHGYKEGLWADTGFYFAVGICGDGAVWIGVSNVLQHADRITLEGRLEELVRLGCKELRARYRHRILKGGVSSRGGAGLGLYVVARMADKILWEFIPLERDIERFTLRVRVKGEQKSN